MDSKNIINDYHRTLNIIRALGVPETRSKSLSGSFNVLYDRLTKEIHYLENEKARYKNMIDLGLGWEDLKNDI